MIRQLIDRHKRGEPVGIYSVCSAHPLVIEAALRRADQDGTHALIEATSNQVNQDGGYTGMLPTDFRDLVLGIARRVGFAEDRVILGGDHLGPNCWQALDAETAMQKSEVLIAEYVAAGFRKIHLDCSMSCKGDPVPLGDSATAERAARLCAVAEAAWESVGGPPPVYVVGTEVPVPGGATETLDELAVTSEHAAKTTLAVHRQAFARNGLNSTWSRVIGLVVQPGVEFDHDKVVDYRPAAAAALSQSIEGEPHIVFEAHSTDYQLPAKLHQLVHDHFAILKVGPALTYALREAYWALDAIDAELQVGNDAAGLRQAMLGAMHEDPSYWRNHYDPGSSRLTLDMQFSLSDRIRYYWPKPAVMAAVEKLHRNLTQTPIPLTLLQQFLPVQYAAVRRGLLGVGTNELIIAKIDEVLRDYASACNSDSGLSR